jgi:hypothetical protein
MCTPQEKKVRLLPRPQPFNQREQGCRETHLHNTAACNASQISCRPARLFPMGAMYRSMDW